MSIPIDEKLAAKAKEVLGTDTLGATVNEALRSVVDLGRRECLIRRLRTHDGLDLTDDKLIESAWH